MPRILVLWPFSSGFRLRSSSRCMVWDGSKPYEYLEKFPCIQPCSSPDVLVMQAPVIRSSSVHGAEPTRVSYGLPRSGLPRWILLQFNMTRTQVYNYVLGSLRVSIGLTEPLKRR